MCHPSETVKYAGCKGGGDAICYPRASPASSWELQLHRGLRSAGEAGTCNLIVQYRQEWFALYKGQFHGHLPWKADGIWKLNSYVCLWKHLLQRLDRMATGLKKKIPKIGKVRTCFILMLSKNREVCHVNYRKLLSVSPWKNVTLINYSYQCWWL